MKSASRQRAKTHCMIVHAYYPLGETRVQRESEALRSSNYEVDVIALRNRDEPAVDRFKGVNVFRLPVRRRRGKGLAVQFVEYLTFFVLAMIKVSRLHFRRRYDTIQVHNPPDFLVFVTWLPRLLGARIIVDLHDLTPEFFAEKTGRRPGSFYVRLIRLQERLACGYAHRVITVSHCWRQALIDRGIAEEKVSVIMNVADDQIFRPSRSRPAPSPKSEGLNLIYHGAVVRRYGLDLVLQALALLGKPDIQFTILGAGDDMGRLMGMAEDLKLGRQVLFWKGLRLAEELPAIILSADAGVVPYRNDLFTDSLIPTKLLEYAALGLPAIAARTTEISRLFDDTMVEFFAPGDVDGLARCIARLRADGGRLSELSIGIRKFNSKYNWTKLGAAFVELVEELNPRANP